MRSTATVFRSFTACFKCLLTEVGKWVKANKGFIYGAYPADNDFQAENGDVLTDGEKYYAVIKNVNMSADPNVALGGDVSAVKLSFAAKRAKWLDNGEKIKINKDNSFAVKSFDYGRSYSVRVAEIEL